MSIWRIRRADPTLDRYGDPVETTTSRVRLPGAFLAPASTVDVDFQGHPGVNQGRQGVAQRLSLYAPPGTDVVPSDRIEAANGEVFDIDGTFADWESPFTGWRAGIQFSLTRVAG